MKSFSDGNAAATRYGFARFGLSSPDGAWTFGNDGVVNDDYPMPCSDEDSKDMPYLRAIFDFIESNPDQFDASKIYAGGFSQNSMFSAYIAFCFNEKVLGVWQGGSGLAYTGEKPYLPGCQAQVFIKNNFYKLHFGKWLHKLGRQHKLFCILYISKTWISIILHFQLANMGHGDWGILIAQPFFQVHLDL